MEAPLPTDVVRGATLRGNEYAWNVASFPDALIRAESHGYACLGGQFQFRLEAATCEMYWLAADASERERGERWEDYSHRSCSEVLKKFNELFANSDFGREAMSWPTVEIDVTRDLVFTAYLVTEAEFEKLSTDRDPSTS